MDNINIENKNNCNELLIDKDNKILQLSKDLRDFGIKEKNFVSKIKSDEEKYLALELKIQENSKLISKLTSENEAKSNKIDSLNSQISFLTDECKNIKEYYENKIKDLLINIENLTKINQTLMYENKRLEKTNNKINQNIGNKSEELKSEISLSNELKIENKDLKEKLKKLKELELMNTHLKEVIKNLQINSRLLNINNNQLLMKQEIDDISKYTNESNQISENSEKNKNCKVIENMKFNNNNINVNQKNKKSKVPTKHDYSSINSQNKPIKNNKSYKLSNLDNIDSKIGNTHYKQQEVKDKYNHDNIINNECTDVTNTTVNSIKKDQAKFELIFQANEDLNNFISLLENVDFKTKIEEFDSTYSLDEYLEEEINKCFVTKISDEFFENNYKYSIFINNLKEIFRITKDKILEFKYKEAENLKKIKALDKENYSFIEEMRVLKTNLLDMTNENEKLSNNIKVQSNLIENKSNDMKKLKSDVIQMEANVQELKNKFDEDKRLYNADFMIIFTAFKDLFNTVLDLKEEPKKEIDNSIIGMNKFTVNEITESIKTIKDFYTKNNNEKNSMKNKLINCENELNQLKIESENTKSELIDQINLICKENEVENDFRDKDYRLSIDKLTEKIRMLHEISEERKNEISNLMIKIRALEENNSKLSNHLSLIHKSHEELE